MDPNVQSRTAHVKANVIIAAVLIVVLLVITLIISGRRRGTSTTDSPTPTLSQNNSGSNGDSPLVSPKVSANFPKSFKNTTIPADFYTQAQAEYGRIPNSQTDTYVETTVKNYYAYSDALKENKIAISPAPKDFKSMEAQVPQLQNQVEASLLSSADFAYIKARYRYHPHESFVKYQYGDLQTKAKAKIEYYRDLLTSGKYTPENLVAISNNDDELMLLNNYEKNEYRTKYNAQGGLFFTDKNFHNFLFSQQAKQVSDVYQLKSIDGTDYAYLIIFANNVTVRKYRTVEELLKDKQSLFK